jgi:hypothetical protein
MRLLVALVVAVLMTALAPALADADVFGPISLASASAIPGFPGNQQVDFAHDAAISGNGRYVAFDGSYAGLTGVWRRDLQSGAVEAVAAENPANPAISAPDADLPSISADGRYVSFTTTAALDPGDDTNPGPDVYVRDMDVPAQACEAGQPCAFALASAADGTSAGLTYQPTGRSSVEFEEKNYGSVATGRSAISADGRAVAFVTTAISDLAGPNTPAMQVAVRYLDSEHTELVSVADEAASGAPEPGQPVSGVEGTEVFGAVYSGKGQAPIFAGPQPYEPPVPVGASISADGSTVAWMGVDIAEQAKLLAAEAPHPAYSEPLWRRIGDGPSAPTRRVTGGSDPGSPRCAASGETELPPTPSLADPCQGPFAALQQGRTVGILTGVTGDAVPRLSADGYEVAFIANAQLAALGEDFGGSEPNSDLYVVNMHEGLTRMQALRPLTELAGADQQDVVENAPIEDLAVAPNGQDLAFTTKRTLFPLGSPAYVSAPEAQPGLLELFEVDLADDTLTRVSQGFEGGPSEHPHEAKSTGEDPYSKPGDGALTPSFSNDGNLLAFSSTASNLAFGDGNTPPLGSDRFDGSDAFVVARVLFSPLPTPQAVSPPPAGPAIKAAWRLGVTVRSRGDGSVLVYVTVPGAGIVEASAQSALRVRVKRRGHLSTSVAMRAVASTRKTTHASTLTTLALTLAARYRSLAARRAGLPGTVNVSFAAPGHAALHESVRVSFRRTLKAKRKAKRK